MPRIKFLQSTQKDFLTNVKKKNKTNWFDIARACKVHPRTLFDWRRNKYQMSYTALQRLKKKYDVDIPRKIEILPENWNIKNAARLGAIRRNELYGSPGTPEGRRKGGLISSLRFRTDPEFARKFGFIIRKQILYPQRSPLLAEFIGIVLGDGTISEYQVRMSTNSKTDKQHAYFIKRIVKKLFNLTCTMALREKNTLCITISSRNLVDFLLNCGLKKGDKIQQMVDVPKWVFGDKELMKGCLRGLVDTDGSIYFHIHTTKGIKYRHMGLCFTSHSTPLLNSVHKMFLELGISAKNNNKNHVFVYSRKELNKYMQIVGSHNIKHIERFKSYKTSKTY